jgi:hypothetical protein
VAKYGDGWHGHHRISPRPRRSPIACVLSRQARSDWPCHHSGKLPIDRFQAEEVLSDIERRCRCTVCGWRRADLRPDYSKQQAAPQSVGWMMPPG